MRRLARIGVALLLGAFCGGCSVVGAAIDTMVVDSIADSLSHKHCRKTHTRHYCHIHLVVDICCDCHP